MRPVLPPAAADPCLSSPAPFFCDYVRQILLSDKALGATRAERDHLLLQGGLTIRTSFDPAVQRAAQQAVDSTVEKTNRAAAAEVIVKPGTGQVLAMAVSRDYGTAPGQTTVALPTQPAFGPGRRSRSSPLPQDRRPPIRSPAVHCAGAQVCLAAFSVGGVLGLSRVAAAFWWLMKAGGLCRC